MTPNRTQAAPQLSGLPPEAAVELQHLAQIVYRLQSRLDNYDRGIPQTQIVGLVKELASKVPQSRRVMTEPPVEGGRDLSADITIRHPGGGGGGTVTSVGLSMPTEFNVAGSPVVAAGTLTVTKDNENANTVWAGPTAGAPAQPTFRALVAADIPAGVGIVTLNPGGNTGPTVTLQAGTAGTDFALSNPGANIVEFDLPTADATHTGKLSNTDWITFSTKPLVVAFYVNNGSSGDPIAADFSPRAGSLTKCKVLVVASDPAVDLTFDIEQNGVSVFSAPLTVAMGTASLTLVDETASLTGTLTVAADDVFKLSISSGSSSWIVSIKLES